MTLEVKVTSSLGGNTHPCVARNLPSEESTEDY
jgi:hypothetical protein